MLTNILIDNLILLLFCLFVLGLALFIMSNRYIRPGSRHAKTSQQRALAADKATSQQPHLQEFEYLIATWVTQKRLAPEIGKHILRLIQEDQAAIEGQSLASTAPAPPWETALLDPLASPIAPVTAPPSPPASPAPPAPATPAAPAPASASAWRSSRFEHLTGALLAFRTRLTLLFLGAFLLVVSALILVIFNWASFPPILQLLLLSGVCASFWVGGFWMTQQTNLTQAGIGLQSVGGVLTPVVLFALSRPGLLNLEPRSAWLLTSLVSLPIYLLAAWRLRHMFFAVAACLGAASTVLAALRPADDQWLLLALLFVLTAYLPLSWTLTRRGLIDLAAAPAWVAHIGVPITLLLTIVLHLENLVTTGALAAILWAGTAFYLLATGLERYPRWAWVTAMLMFGALVMSLQTMNVNWPWHGLALALLALVYLGSAWVLEPHHPPYALPGYTGTAILTPLALLVAQTDIAVVRWALPVLIIVGAVIMLADHRQRLAWLTAHQRLMLATTGLVLAGTLLVFWLLALFDLTTLSSAERGLWLLPLAVCYFVGAYAWLGRVRQAYDWTLQMLGTLLTLGVSMVILQNPLTQVRGIALVTAIWIGQTLLRRRRRWAALALGFAFLMASLQLPALLVSQNIETWIWTGLVFTVVYAAGGTLLYHTAWRCWSWPGIVWAVLIGSATLCLMMIDIMIIRGQAMPLHVLALLILAFLLGFMTISWRQAWLGYSVALLLALALLLLARQDFLVGWPLTTGDYGYLLCGITLGLVLLGQAIRWIIPTSPGYAYPYEIVGFVLLIFAPLLATASLQHTCLTWGTMALLYAMGTWRYQLPWMLVPAFGSADIALLAGAGWLLPSTRPADAGWLLLGAAWVQAWFGFWAQQGTRTPDAEPPDGQQPAHRQWRVLAVRMIQTKTMASPSFVVASLSGLGALTLASSDSAVFTMVALGLTLLAALLGTLKQQADLAWIAVLLAAWSLASLHQSLGLNLYWSMAWGVFEALWFCLLGWGIAFFNQQPALRARMPGLAIWQRPLTAGPLAAGLGLCSLLLLLFPLAQDVTVLTFALVNLALLLTTLAVRQHALGYAYGAGAALVAAGLCQLYQWGFREPQWYTIPAGVYLLALAEGLRHFQGRHQLLRMIETGAVLLMLGITLGQSLRTDSLESLAYATLLCVKALLILGYGMLRKLRVPFLGGLFFFILGVLWISIDPLRATNRWLLLGALGMLLVSLYVLLERRQEQLVRAGRVWYERVSRWP